MIEQEFIKVAKQLQTTDDKEVVKIAGILNRLKNLFKKITDPYYREAVENMHLESGTMAEAAKHLNKHLNELQSALKDGDVYNYKKAKNALDNALEEFKNAKENVDSKAGKIHALTELEDKNPGAISKITEKYERQPEYDIELDKEYEGRSLKEFAAYHNVKNIYINAGDGRTAAKVFLGRVVQALVGSKTRKERDKYIEKYFSEDSQTELLSEYSKAILLGELTRVKAVEQGDGKPSHWTDLEVRSLPFKIPSVGVTIQAMVVLRDKRMDILKPANITLIRTEKIDLAEPPQEEVVPKNLEEIVEEIQETPIVEAPTEETTKNPIEEVVEKSVDKSVEEFVEESVKKDIGESTEDVQQFTPEELEAKELQEKLQQGMEFARQKDILEDEEDPQTKKSSLPSLYMDIIKHADQIPYKTTKLSQLQFAEAMREGYRIAFGEEPTAEILAGGWAQAILESGRPVKLPNNNVGNIKATSGWVKSGNPFFTKRTGEYTSEGEYYIEEGTKWRAYSTPEAGAAGYWKLLGRRYPKAIDWMAAGDPTSASVVLGLNGYYTASIEGYSKSVSNIYQEFMTKIAPQMSGLESAPATPPGQKPPVKKWNKDYTKEERAEVLNSENDTAPTTEVPADDDEVDQLITKLIAGPLTKIVERAIIKKALPKSTSLIILSSNSATIIEKIEFAHVASSMIDCYLDIDARVCRKEGDIQIHCSGSGTEMVMTGAIQDVCEMVSYGIKDRTGTRIYATAIAGGMSTFDEIKSDVLIKNRKQFNMRRIANAS